MSPPPGHEPFLRAICQAPDDDAPRLVFADWLDENGDPERAEFIRLQVRLAREPEAAGVERRCDELFRVKSRSWVGALPGPNVLWAEYVLPRAGASWDGQPEATDAPAHVESRVKSSAIVVDWARGFPVAVYVQGSSDVFFANLDPITEFVPVNLLRLVNLDDLSNVIARLTSHRFLAKLRFLIGPRVSLSDDVAIALAKSPFAAGLRFLSLNASQLSDRAGRAFAESPYLVGLKGLQLLQSEFNGTTRTLLRARFGFKIHL
jgi:uncharacterized protein (TIGR02996 family)